MIGRHEGPFHAARRLTEQHVMSLSSAPRALLKTASLLMMALSVTTAAFIGFELGTKLIERWTIGGHDGGALLVAAIGVALALVKCMIPIVWTRRQFTRREAAVAFVIWVGCSVYLCTAVVGFGIGLVVRMDASEREVALFVGLWLVIEIAMGLLPGIAWPDKDATERVIVPNEPIELREEANAALPLPAILDQPPRRNLLALLHHLATGPPEHGVQKTRDGRLVTTQRRLAVLAGIAAGQVNTELRRLQKEQAITLTTSSRRTVIGIRS